MRLGNTIELKLVLAATVITAAFAVALCPTAFAAEGDALQVSSSRLYDLAGDSPYDARYAGAHFDSDAHSEGESLSPMGLARASAAMSGSCGENIKWKLTGTKDNYKLTLSGKGRMYDYMGIDEEGKHTPWMGRSDITSIVVGKGITYIGDNAFEGLQKAKTVYLPSGITEIGSGAFYYCQSLQSVTLPNTVRKLGGSVFFACTELKSVSIPNGVKTLPNGLFEYCYSLERVNVPNSVTVIEQAFMECKSLKRIKLPSNLTSISSLCFAHCESLEEISIPDKVKVVEPQTFQGCTSLRKIRLGRSVESIGVNSTFAYCEKLEEIDLSAKNKHFTLRNGVLYNKKRTELVLYPPARKARSYAVPNGVLTIPGDAFSECANLETITLPSTLKEIGAGAFWGCTALKSISIPSGVTRIEDSTFSGCSKLKSVRLSSHITRVGEDAFKACTSLKSITLPAKTSYIGERAFWGADSLSTITIKAKSFYIRGANTIPEDAVITGYKNSDAERYARSYGRQFRKLGSKKVVRYSTGNKGYIRLLPTAGITPSGISAVGSTRWTADTDEFLGYNMNFVFERPVKSATYQQIKAKVNEITKGKKGDSAKAKAIMEWVNSYIEYAWGSATWCDIDSILSLWGNPRGNCMSYTMLTNYMLYLAGIPSLVISSADHQWSGALIGGRWVMIDSTNYGYDVNPDDFDPIEWISFADGPWLIMVDNLLDVSLAGVSKGYLNSKKITKTAFPTYVTKCYDGALGDLPASAVVTGRLGTLGYSCCKDSLKYTVTKEGRFEASNKVTNLPKTKLNDASVTIPADSFTYTGKAITPIPTVKAGSKRLSKQTDYTFTYANNKKAGIATVKVVGKGLYSGTVIKRYRIEKAENPLVLKAKTAAKKVSFKALQKKKAVVEKLVSVKKAEGKVSYWNAGKTAKLKRFKVNSKSGAVTVPKGAARGTYKLSVKVSARGNANYKHGNKTVTVVIKVA